MLLVFVALQSACAYEVRIGRTDANSFFRDYTVIKGHWDESDWRYDGATQALSCYNWGNSTYSLGDIYFNVRPLAGEPTSGFVQLRFGYKTSETITYQFDNFEPLVFDYHYDFGYRFNVGNSQPAQPLDPTGGTVSYFTLDVPIGPTLSFSVLPVVTEVHAALWSTSNGLWQPQVIDPNLSGKAIAHIVGDITLVSIEVVPEPGSFGIFMLGAAFLWNRLRLSPSVSSTVGD